MYLFGTNQSIEAILPLPVGSYTGLLAEGDYSLEEFPEQEQLKQLAKEYWLSRHGQISGSEASNRQGNAHSQMDKHEFQQRQTHLMKRLVSEILQEDMKIETILRKLTQEQFGNSPLLSQKKSRDILSLLDPSVYENNAESPLIRRLKASNVVTNV